MSAVSRLFFLLTLIIAALLALLVTAMNAAPADIELAFLHVSAPLGVALVVAFTVGMLAGLFWRAHWIAQLLSERGRMRRALKVAGSHEKDAS